jgi:hypothetical protein
MTDKTRREFLSLLGVLGVASGAMMLASCMPISASAPTSLVKTGDQAKLLIDHTKGATMQYGIVHQFAGGTQEQYEASIAAVHPSRDTLPEGQIFHAAGPTADGWTVVAVHDSKESWEKFRDGILLPRMQQGIEGGFTTPPQETAFEVYNLQT